MREVRNNTRIAIDCFKQIKGTGKSIGIYNYTVNLVKNLSEYKKDIVNNESNDAELIVIGNEYNKEDFNIPGIEFICITKFNPLSKACCVIWELFLVTYVCKKLDIDKVIFPRGFCAISHLVKDIIIVHDLIPFYYNKKFPGEFNKFENAYVMNRLRSSVKTCDRVITISESSKKDILKYCDVSEEKIHVIYNGFDEKVFRYISKCASKPYICAITSKLPHKNARGIFESYKKYCEISKNPMDIKVIGVDNTGDVDFPEIIKKKIACYRFIKNDDDLYKIISESRIFLFLSLKEGFGFPIIEAMQLKVPVICSNTSSLPEVANDAAVLVNPHNPEEVAIEIDKLVNDPRRIDDLIRKGEQNIKRFSWCTRAELYWKNILG